MAVCNIAVEEFYFSWKMLPFIFLLYHSVTLQALKDVQFAANVL